MALVGFEDRKLGGECSIVEGEHLVISNESGWSQAAAWGSDSGWRLFHGQVSEFAHLSVKYREAMELLVGRKGQDGSVGFA
jgi:hypothetical protein